jgi:hypothetical protein
VIGAIISAGKGGAGPETGPGGTAGIGGTNGMSATVIAAGLGGAQGTQWRLLLKQRCPSIMAHPAEYDVDLFRLCQLVARLR